jgi:acetyltransferase-like isoleucine patch superfamily enzyme
MIRQRKESRPDCERARTIPGDWHPGIIPENVVVDRTAYLETTYSFLQYRSEEPVGVRIDPGASVYQGTMFDVGPRGQVRVGRFALVNGARIICDAEVEIGEYALISWNVVLMDTYRASLNPNLRRLEVQQVARFQPRRFKARSPARPIRIGSNVWIGFEVCILPGVTVGDGAVIGARSVVAENVPPYTVVAGNPARVVRRLPKETARHAS